MVLEMDESIRYPYWVEFDDLTEQTFQLSLNPITLKFLPAIPPSKPDWSKLQFHQCHNSPLGTDVEYCPVAVNLAHMVEGFKGRNPIKKPM